MRGDDGVGKGLPSAAVALRLLVGRGVWQHLVGDGRGETWRARLPLQRLN